MNHTPPRDHRTVTHDDIPHASQPVLEEVSVQLDLLDGHGVRYARETFAHALGLAALPTRPKGMHPRIAEALRDIARDEAAAIRLYGRRHKPGTNQPSSPSPRLITERTR